MRSLLTFILVLSCFASFAQSEEEAVKQTINSAYIGGIQNDGPVADIRKGFHPSFVMHVLNNNDVRNIPLEEWIGNIEKSRASNTGPAQEKAVAKFVNVIVTGTAASATLEVHRGAKHIFTDNLLLYKFAEGWRIVGKNFYRHP